METQNRHPILAFGNQHVTPNCDTYQVCLGLKEWLFEVGCSSVRDGVVCAQKYHLQGKKRARRKRSCFWVPFLIMEERGRMRDVGGVGFEEVEEGINWLKMCVCED